MASAARVMEKPIAHQNQQQQQQQQQQILKCPRCDSSNTKFCYYNNYNLSQPRHFCKACKRYWTRGGTLRNVPVGGGCRKNKRIKRPITSTSTSTSAHAGAVIAAPAPVDQNPNLNSNPNLDHLPSSSSINNSNHHLNPLFYGLLPQNPSFPRFDSRVSNVNNNNSSNVVSGYDFLQPHMSHLNDLGLGFSSHSSGEQIMANHNSNSLFSSYPPMFGGGSTSSSTGAPSMASLLASSLQQQQRFMGFAPYEEGGGSAMKDVKMEGTQGRMDWNINNFHGQNNNNQIEAVGSSNPNSLLWNTTAGGDGGWSDPTENLDSSVSSLI